MESIPPDHNSDSESSGTSSKPASSSSKESTLPAKQTYDNEESPSKNHILDHGNPKKKLIIQSRSLITKNTLHNSGIKFIHDDI